jgi:hypothetical protein
MNVPLVRLEDDLRLAVFAHGPPEGAPEITDKRRSGMAH